MSEFNTELFKAFAEIEDKDDNLILSPFSISSYLSMQANYCSNINTRTDFQSTGVLESRCTEFIQRKNYCKAWQTRQVDNSESCQFRVVRPTVLTQTDGKR